MDVVATIAAVIGGGIAGSFLTYCLTWFRERRRTLDAYRAPQRVAIAGIVTATHQLWLRDQEFRQVTKDLSSEAEGSLRRDYSFAELDQQQFQYNRALFGVEEAFAIGRLTIVDPACFEAMGIAANEFQKIKTELPKIEAMPQTMENASLVPEMTKQYVTRLKRHVDELVKEGQQQLTPIQSRRHKRERERARARLGAKYFNPKELDEGRG